MWQLVSFALYWSWKSQKKLIKGWLKLDLVKTTFIYTSSECIFPYHTINLDFIFLYQNTNFNLNNKSFKWESTAFWFATILFWKFAKILNADIFTNFGPYLLKTALLRSSDGIEDITMLIVTVYIKTVSF